MHPHVSPTSILSNEPMTYHLLSETEVLDKISKSVAKVNESLCISSPTVVRLLLNHFHWDQATLTDRYWEDSKRVFSRAKLADPGASSASIDYSPLSPPSNNEHEPTCRTCCLDKPLKDFYSLACNHLHCLSCWGMYIRSVIDQDGNAAKISCPSRCNQVVDDEQVFAFLADDAKRKQDYERQLINAYVATNSLTRWCPGKDCSTIVKMKSNLTDSSRMISCDRCKSVFCFHCGKEWHDPVQCDLLVKWEKKNRDESMTGEWLIANTKDCPGCHSSIEKNGGCNHMTCRKPGCANEFCWICLGPWKDHASNQCNVYNNGEKNKSELSARENLARYLHYFTRYHTHNQSLELEGKLSEQIEQRIKEMQAESMSYSEQRAIYKAFDVLRECRRTLKYTYAFAYYLYRNNQAEVFHQNQADLERATEALSGFLEQEIDAEKNISVKLMDKTRYCEQRSKVLLNHCKEGYAEHYWAGLEPY